MVANLSSKRINESSTEKSESSPDALVPSSRNFLELTPEIGGPFITDLQEKIGFDSPQEIKCTAEFHNVPDQSIIDYSKEKAGEESKTLKTELRELQLEYNELQNKFLGIMPKIKEFEKKVQILDNFRSNTVKNYEKLNCKLDEIEQKTLVLQKEKNSNKILLREFKFYSVNMEKFKKRENRLTSDELKNLDTKYRQFSDQCCNNERTIQKTEVNLQKLFYELRNFSKKFNPANFYEDGHICSNSANGLSHPEYISKMNFPDELDVLPLLLSGVDK